MTDQNYIDMEGVENIAVAMVRQARNDFIKGGKILYKVLKTIPTYNELIKNKLYPSLANDKDVRWMYDAWRFVEKDPYDFFEVGDAEVISEWKLAAIQDYYRSVYIKIAPVIYSQKPSNNHIHELTDEELNGYLEAKDIEQFKEARDYALNLAEAEEILKEWNHTSRYRRKDARMDKIRAQKNREQLTEARKIVSEESKKKRARAKELYEAGLSRRAIAKELGVQLVTVHYYLRS